EIERQLDTELAVVLYAERDKGDKGPGGFLSANAHGQVYLTSLATSPSPSPASPPSSPPSSSSSSQPHSALPSPRLRSSLNGVGGGGGSEALEQKREEVVWVMRWYRPKWPATLAHLYAELHEATVAGPTSPASSSSSYPSSSSSSSSSTSSSS